MPRTHYPLPPLVTVYYCCFALDIIKHITSLVGYRHLISLYDISASVQFVILVFLLRIGSMNEFIPRTISVRFELLAGGTRAENGPHRVKLNA
jgi:hypothetical protein